MKGLVRDLVRWMRTQREGRPSMTDSLAPTPLLEHQPPITPPEPQNRAEFQAYIENNDREMAYIQEIVAAIRQERPDPPGTAESASR
jgi:hypothetical protein